METFNEKINAVRAGLAGLGECPAAEDFRECLKECDSGRDLWRFLGICYLTHHTFLAVNAKEKPSPETVRTAELARKNMKDLRRIAEMLDRCGVENPEGISPDVIDRDGQEDFTDRFCEICGDMES